MDSKLESGLDGYEPEEWFVVFSRSNSRWWARWLAMGRYSHVSAFGEVKSAGIWLFFEVFVGRTQVLAVPDDRVDVVLGEMARGTTIVRMPPQRIRDDRVRLKPGFWCVPAVAHLLGLSSCALRPDRLLAQCLANGGTIVVDENEGRGPERGPRDQEAAAGGGERQD